MSNSASGSFHRGTEEVPVHTTSFQDSGPWKRWDSSPPTNGFGMTPWCDDLVCSWRRLLADRHSLPFPWTLSLHRRWCPSASHHPLTFLFLLALTFPLPSPFPSLGLSLCRPPCPSASPHSFPSLPFPLVGCANGAPGLALFHFSALSPRRGRQMPSPLAKCVQAAIPSRR